MNTLLCFVGTSTARILLLVAILGGPSSILADVDQELETSAPRRFIVTQLVDDLRYIVSEPDFYAVIGGLSLGPQAFRSAFRNESPEFTELWGPSRFADGFFEAGEIFGNGMYPLSVSVSTWTIGKISGSESLKSFGSDLLRAQAINGIFTTAMKGLVNRTRPDGAPYSYPSGHTSSAFATAGVIHKHYGIKWGLPAFVVASYVGLSRLQENKHYLSDVVAGGILGSYIGLKIAGRGDRRSRQLSISPTTGDVKGIAAAFKF